jgi:myo-inositol-1(or 4)-monophosphatase
MNLTKEKRIATEVAKRSGKMLMSKFNTLGRANVRLKSKHEVVTPADLKSEKIILTAIKKNFPDHKILSEEVGKTGAASSDYLWIVDPLDGTTNFSMGNPLFSISIALAKNNKIIMGLIYVPFLNELYYSEMKKNSTLNNKKINVSNLAKINQALLTFCHGNDNQSINKANNIHYYFKTAAKDIRQIGSAAIELTWVARGKTEAIIIPGAHSWDVAAGALIVRNAGGTVTNMLGHEWSLDSDGIIASNKKISDSLIRTVKNIK